MSKNRLEEMVFRMDLELDIQHVPDYPGAYNGLQLSNSGKVTKVAAAVDASLPVIKKAIECGADLLVVHHGLFWQGIQPLVGVAYEKVRLAMENDLAIYSSHIPLDVHVKMGNNAILAAELGLVDVESFFEWKGIQLGLKGRFLGSLSDFIETVENVVEGKVHHCLAEPNGNVGLVGVITGGAGSEVAQMAKLGVKTFLTGEGPHWSYTLAEELGVNMIYAGHYATETFGVKALSNWIADKMGVGCEFIHHPSGL